MSSNNTLPQENNESAYNDEPMNNNELHNQGSEAGTATHPSSSAIAANTTDPLATLAALIAALPVPSRASAPRGEFEVFPNLAIELRLKVWEASTRTPQLIHWRPGGGKQPALLAVNKEARGVALERYTLCFDRFERSGIYAIYVNMDVDTVYRKQMMPNLVRVRETPPFPIPLTMDIAAPTGPGWNIQYWSKSIRRLCISIHEATAVAPMRAAFHSRHQTLWLKLKAMCPTLEELTIVVPTNGRRLWELGQLVDLPADFVSPRELGLMAGVTADLGRVQGRGDLPNLTIKFQTF